jgi:hypothetical protein
VGAEPFFEQTDGAHQVLQLLILQRGQTQTCKASLTRIFHEFTPWRDCDHGYGSPSWRPQVLAPATYHPGTPRNQNPAVAWWHAHLPGLATAIHEISGLSGSCQILWSKILAVGADGPGLPLQHYGMKAGKAGGYISFNRLEILA